MRQLAIEISIARIGVSINFTPQPSSLWPSMFFEKNQSSNPLFSISLAVIAGVVAARYWGALTGSWVGWCVVAAVALAVLAADIFRRNSRPLYLFFLALAGFTLYTLRAPERAEVLPYDQNIEFAGRAISTSEQNRRYDRLQVEVLSYKDSINGIWQQGKQKLELNVDTALIINAIKGNVIAFRGKVRRVEGSYGEWLYSQGVVGKVYAYRAAIIDSTRADTTFKEHMAVRRATVANRIIQIDTSKTAATSIMSALTVGERSEIPREQKAEYRRAGVSHLLAISGLHVGIMVVMLNFVFGFVRVWRHGQLVFSLVVIALLWWYALFTGLSASVVRAVVMFTLFQLSLITMQSYSSLNILSAAALIMILIDPTYVFDVGFQLSFGAMLGIVTLYNPIASLLKVKNGVLGALWSVTVVSVAAQLAVAPMVVYYFGQLPLMGIGLNIVVWITVPVIIASTFLFLLTGLDFVGSIGLYVTQFQNDVIGLIASQPWSAVENLDMSLWLCVGIYAIIIALALWFIGARASAQRREVLGAKYNL